MTLQCCACLQVKSLEDFSNSQLRKKEAPRCGDCVKSDRKVVIDKPAKGNSTRCEQCKMRHDDNNREESAKKKRQTLFLCAQCSRENNRKRKERENEVRRCPEHGACKVKDVKKKYGHLCEIPIQAYREAGVASNRNDYVTEEDVGRASNAWDARSIAHDIDTQWGTMPWGGAYSDSNHYYGPGEYDFY